MPLFRVLALYFLFTALGKAHEYRLRRTLEFRKLFWPQLLAGLTKGAVSIVLALAGAGAWSLIIGQLAGALCQSAVLWRVHPWRPSFVISRSHLRPMLRFGLGIVAVGLLGQGAANFDFLVVGAKLGAVALGVYYLAFRLPELVILSGFQVANDVLFPFYARLKEGEISGADELRRGYLETVRLGSMVAFPAAFAMAALALPLVLTLYGEQWRAAAEPLAFVAIWAGLASLASMPGAVFKALGRSWLLTATGVMQIAILFPAVWFAADYSITAVAAAQVVEKTISLALLGVVIGRILGIPWYATFTAGAPALALSALMAAALYPLGQVCPRSWPSPRASRSACSSTSCCCAALCPPAIAVSPGRWPVSARCCRVFARPRCCWGCSACWRPPVATGSQSVRRPAPRRRRGCSSWRRTAATPTAEPADGPCGRWRTR